jgi:hypothetical protein
LKLRLQPPNKARATVVTDALLKASGRHFDYIVEARERKAKGIKGTYHAFGPDTKVLEGDIIATDRRPFISRRQELKTVAQSALHCDIVTLVCADVAEPYVETIGGNVGHTVRRRRYPLAADGKPVLSPERLYSQENDAGTFDPFETLPYAPSMLQPRSAGRIFAVLRPVEKCVTVRSSAPGPAARAKDKELADAFDVALESPFITDEILSGRSAPEWDTEVSALDRESPYLENN